jgi:hypothetical protein
VISRNKLQEDARKSKQLQLPGEILCARTLLHFLILVFAFVAAAGCAFFGAKARLGALFGVVSLE